MLCETVIVLPGSVRVSVSQSVSVCVCVFVYLSVKKIEKLLIRK